MKEYVYIELSKNEPTKKLKMYENIVNKNPVNDKYIAKECLMNDVVGLTSGRLIYEMTMNRNDVKDSHLYAEGMADTSDEPHDERSNEKEVKIEEPNIEEIPNDIESIGLVLDLIGKSNQEIVISEEELYSSQNKLKEDKKTYLRKLINGYKRAVASALAVCSIVSVGFLGNTFAKSVSKDKGICNRRTEMYEQVDGKVRRIGDPQNYDVYYKGQSDKVLIKVYEPLDDNNIRNVKEYDVSDVNVSKIEDYFDVDVTNREYTISEEKMDENTLLSNENDDTFKTVKINTYDREHIENETYGTALGLYYSFYAAFIAISLVISLINYREWGSLYFYIDDLKESLKDFKEYKKNVDFDKQIELINNKKEEILNEISKNDELKNKFLEMYTSNMYLMNDPTVFKSRFDEAIREVDTINLRKELTK